MEATLQKSEAEECHIVALKNGVVIEIDKAPSGRGYECIGCHREMQAVHFPPPHLSYFRHHPNDVEKHHKCQWSDETYRHGVAKSLLLALKRIKVPAVKKFPPPGIAGTPNIIRKKRWVSAPRVEQELYFFEDDQGNIRWQGHIPNGSKCFHIIKPDIVFFNKDDQPILFVELVATHKVSEDKKIKINRIGVDTVQLIVPKSCSADIEKAFSITKQTKWIFNHEEQRAKYIPVPEGGDATLSKADREQRKLYEETLSCWNAQIGDLIRSINRCLSSEQYRSVERAIKDEIARIDGEIGQVENELRRRREQLAISVPAEFIEENRRVDREEQSIREKQSDLNREEINLGIDDRGLEKRYRTKVEQLRTEEKEFAGKLDAEETELIEKIGEFDGSESGAREAFEQHQRDLERDIEAARSGAEELRRKTAELSKPSTIQNDSAVVELNEAKRRTRSAIERLRGLIEQEPAKTEGLRIGIESKFENAQAELDAKFFSEGTELGRRLKDGDYEGAAKLSQRIAGILSLRRQLDVVIEAQRSHKRIRAAFEAIRQGTYKNWIDTGGISETI